MAITAATLTNPGAEAGSTTGWTVAAGALSVSTSSPHSGTYKFKSGSSPTVTFHQTYTVDAGLHAAIDAGDGAAQLLAWHIATDSDEGHLTIVFYAANGSTVLGSAANDDTSPNSWTQEELKLAIPALTRFIRIGTVNTRNAGGGNDSDWDDFELNISDDIEADFPADARAYQLGVTVIGQQPAEGILAHTLAPVAVASAETSNGNFLVTAHQLGVYALVRGLPRRIMRAYTFKQDDHEFYGINLGETESLLFDKLTGQWCQWRSPDYNYWRVADAVAWEGFNVACDPLSGKIWQIDAEGRKDYDTTPITSQVTGMLTERFRKHVPVFMAELALSEAQPPSGVDAGEVSIQLRTHDGLSWYDHGSIPSEAVGDDITVRWYGLGLVKSPGTVFEITDTGYARRIDGLNIEMGG